MATYPDACGDLTWLWGGSSRLTMILHRADEICEKLVGTVFTSALPPAPGQPQRRAAPHRCVRSSVAIGYYVTITETPAPRSWPWNSPASSPRPGSAMSRTRVTPRPRRRLRLWRGRVEERRDHRQQPFGPVHYPAALGDKVCGAGEHHELGFGEAGQIPHRAATQKSEHLDGVFETDDVGVADDDHGRRLDPPDVLGRPGEGHHVQTLELLDQCRKVLGVRREHLVGRLHRGPSEHLGRDGRDHLVQLGLHALA